MKKFDFEKVKNAFKQKNIIIGLITIIVTIIVIVGYKDAYVPHRITSIAENNGFTESAGFTCHVKPRNHIIIITTNKKADQQIMKEAYNTGFEDETLQTENKLSKVANAVSEIPMSGKWDIKLKTQGAKNGASIWSFNGQKEENRLQDTSFYAQCREELQQQQESSDDANTNYSDEDQANAMMAAGGFLGGLFGSFFNGLDQDAAEQQNSIDWGSIADRAGNAAAETPQP